MERKSMTYRKKGERKTITDRLNPDKKA